MQKNCMFADKANQYKQPLKHRAVQPVQLVKFCKNEVNFQKLTVCSIGNVNMPHKINPGDSVIFDFGDHCVGYLHFAIEKYQSTQIVDSPVKLKFSFGEFPLEIVTPPEQYKGWLGCGWLQNETKTVVFAPYEGSLERRYAFRYLKIERVDNGPFPIVITDLFADCVSSVDFVAAPMCNFDDPVLNKIYTMSVKTLKDCEQDVFEDGPKRDRRMWIGDLRLQAMTDYVTFENIDLIKRSLYLFAAYRTDRGFVSPYIFPDSPPHTDEWIYIDYSLFFISCLYDFIKYSSDREILAELYPTAKEQAELVSNLLDRETGSINEKIFVDWCPDLDKDLAVLGVFIYSLRQLLWLAEQAGEDTCWIENEIEDVKAILLRFYDKTSGMFITAKGQLSWHSQLWAIISQTVVGDDAIRLIHTMQEINPEYKPHTPYMMHCYIEALDKCGMQDEVIQVIKDFWGQIAEAGFDCCPEVFNPSDQFESPYGAPEINSACHAWSCTPAYWLRNYFPDSEV